MLHYYTQPWYYITLLAFVACSLDVLFGVWPISANQRVLPLLLRSSRLAAGLALLCFAGLPDWEEMPVRHTNVDLLAARLRPLAASGDVILVPSLGMRHSSGALLSGASGDYRVFHPSTTTGSIAMTSSCAR